MPENLVSSTSLERDNLFSGAVQRVVTETVTLKGGRAYKRGTVVGLIDTETKCTIINSANTDGSERPYGIVTDDVDATEGDAVSAVYLTGEYNAAALIFGGTDTASNHKRALREMGIFLGSTIKA